MEKLKYNLNEIDEKIVQIYGNVNGFAVKNNYINGHYTYILSFRFILNKTLYKIETSEKDGTMTNVEKVKNRIEQEIAKIEKIEREKEEKEIMEIVEKEVNYSTHLIRLWLLNEENNYKEFKKLSSFYDLLDDLALRKGLQTHFVYGDDLKNIDWYDVQLDEIKQLLKEESERE